VHARDLVTVEDYEPLIGAEGVERIGRKAECLRDLHVINVNPTYYGGGVAEIRSSLTLLMNACGVRTGRRVTQGRPDFFTITKKMHNALQGNQINLSELNCIGLQPASNERLCCRGRSIPRSDSMDKSRWSRRETSSIPCPLTAGSEIVHQAKRG
jgi:hypothetical protein